MIIFTENKKITIKLRLLFYNIIKCFPKTFMCIPIICRSDNIYLKYIFFIKLFNDRCSSILSIFKIWYIYFNFVHDIFDF